MTSETAARRRHLPSDLVPSWVPWLTVGAVVATVVGILQPHLVLSDSTPTGGDMGAHVLGPAFLRDFLLPSGTVIGWSDSWFAGFPAFYFYFPLPSIVIVLLDVLLPYGVAFKIVTTLGLIATPVASYYLARSMELPRVIASSAGVAGGAFVLIESFTIYGGNVASTMAGEFSFSWSFALGLTYLGLTMRAIRDDRRLLPLAALALGLTALAHVITTIMFVIASLPMLFWRQGALRVVTTWVWGFFVSAFWSLPLLRSIGYTADMAWSPLRRWDEIFPTEVWILAIPAAVGLGWALARTRRAPPLVLMTFVPIVYFWLPFQAERLELYDGTWKLWNGRLLPFWFFGVVFFAGITFGLVSRALIRRLPATLPTWTPFAAFAVLLAPAMAFWGEYRFMEYWAWGLGGVGVVALGLIVNNRYARAPTSALVTSLAGFLLLSIIAAGTSFLPGWARWNYTGYEAKEKWPEYESLMQTIDGLPPGRVQWEANKELNSYGTPMALMLTPYWSEGHPSMEGLYFESSLTTPFHFLNAGALSHKPSNPIPGLDYHTFEFDRGVEYMDTYAVSYYVSFTEEATNEATDHPALTKLAESEPFTVFAFPETSMVEVLDYQPSVYEAKPDGMWGVFAADEGGVGATATFHEFALEWYDDLSLLDMVVTAEGPDHWVRVESVTDVAEAAWPLDPAPARAVSNITSDNGVISFDTTALGRPHVVKMSYFPNWEVEGALGPYRATPSLMVVVPTEESVTLEFRRQWPEQVGLAMSAVAWLALLGLAARKLWNSRAD